MARGQVTISDVAKAAGVAVSTVSRVLNDGSTSARTQEKVERVIAELRFVPSAAARNLKNGKTGIVGIAGASARAPWFIELLEGMEDVLSQQGASIAISSWQDGDRYQPGPIRAWIRDRRIDHLVLVRPGEKEKKLLSLAERAHIPTVSVVPDVPSPNSLVVGADNFDAGKKAGKHLVELGHREICFFGGPIDSIDARERLRGVRAQLSETGLALGDHRVRFASSYEAVSGVELAKKWLRTDSLRKCSAAVLGNDALALGFLRGVLSEGVRVPEELSVIGFDGLPAGALVWPGLTSVAQPVSAMGRDIAERLLARGPFPPTPLTYPSKLILRESTAAPAHKRGRATASTPRPLRGI